MTICPRSRSIVRGTIFVLTYLLAFPLFGQPIAPAGESFVISDQAGPQLGISRGPDGRFLLVWQRRNEDETSLWARRLASDGAPLGEELMVNTVTSGSQKRPSAASFPNGDFLVVWEGDVSAGSDPNSQSIQARFFGSNGSFKGSEFQINSSSGSRPRRPTVAAVPDGFLVFWNHSPSTTGITGQKLSPAGTALGEPFVVTETQAEEPKVVTWQDGEFAVVWLENGYEGSPVVQRFDSAGQTTGSAFRVRGDADGYSNIEAYPGQLSVAQRENGDFIVVWRSYYGFKRVHGRIVGQDGEFKSPSRVIDFGEEPHVTARANGEFVVSSSRFLYNEYTGDYSTYWSVHRIQPDGTPMQEKFTMDSGSYPSESEVFASFVPTDVARLNDDRFLVVWADAAVGELFGQRFNASCVADEQTLCLGPEGRFQVQVQWTDFMGLSGSARVIPASAVDSGLLYFFDANNWEMLVKVVNGCELNGHFWVFAAATTNVEYTLTVTDTVRGEIRDWTNPLGAASPAVTDTMAFPTCP